MQIKILFCFIVACLINTALFADQKVSSEMQQIQVVAEIVKNSSSPKMHQVWPSYNLQTKPLFITFGNGHIYAFNMKFNGPDWTRKNIKGIEVFYTDKDRWGITAAPMQFDFEIQGREAFVYRLDMMTEPAFLPFFVLVHERFHVFQIQNFKSEQFEEGNFPNNYPESENADNLALMQLEELVLLDFMKALHNHSQKEAIMQLKTFISIHKQRQKLLSPQSLEWEDRQQMVEGLADYASAKNLDVFGYFGNMRGESHILQTMDRYTKDDDITARALKWRHYGVGASLGYALDFLQVPNWKKAVEQNIALQSLLERNLKVSSEESNYLFQQAVQKYNFVKLNQEIRNKISAYNQMLNSHREKFKKLPGIVVNLQTPPDSGLSAGGHSRGVYSLADGSMFSVEDTSKTSSADNRWILELRSMPYLFQSNDGFRRFKIGTEDLEVVVDGQSCSLKNLRNTPFHHLTLRSPSCSFKSTYNQGVISMRDGEIRITYWDEV